MYNPTSQPAWLSTPGMRLPQTVNPTQMRLQQALPSIGQAIGQQGMPQAAPISQVDTYHSPTATNAMGSLTGNQAAPMQNLHPTAPMGPAPQGSAAAPTADPSAQGLQQLQQMSKMMQQLRQQRSANPQANQGGDPLNNGMSSAPKAPMGLLGDTSPSTTPSTSPTTALDMSGGNSFGDFDWTKMGGLLGGGSWV